MLVNVQILRFVAALLVVLFHSAAYLEANGQVLGPVFSFGHYAGFAGVDIFFVISGFIMAWTTSGTAGGADALLFMKRRFARVYSGYWLFFLIALVLIYLLEAPRLAKIDFLRSFFLLPTDIGQLLLPVSWTLIFELFFYVLFGLLIALVGDRRPFWTRAIFCIALVWFVYSQFIRQAYVPGIIESMSVLENYWAFPFLLQFFAGAMLADWLRVNREGPAWSLVISGASLWLVAGWVNHAYFADTLTQGHQIMWRVWIFGVPSLLLLAGVVRLEFSGRTWLPRFGSLAGGSSYALYLSHTLLLFLSAHLGLHIKLQGLSVWIVQAAYLMLVAVIVLYSLGHYRWFERPMHRFFRRTLGV